MQFRFHEANRHCKCQFSKQTVIVAIVAQTVKLHCAISLSANAMGSPSLSMPSQEQLPYICVASYMLPAFCLLCQHQGMNFH